VTDNLERFYSADYFSARARFREAAAAAECKVETFPVDSLGPDAQPLTIDVARVGSSDAENLVIVSSGLHGIEGFFGAAVQLAWFAQLRKNDWLPGSTAVLLLHALNPYGFAWLRRVNENNVDPNRNGLLPDEKFEGSPPGYAALDRLLNPTSPPKRFEPFLPKAAWNIARRGLPALKQAVAAGQYDFPKGLFYGGAQPSQSHQIVKSNLARWIAPAKCVLHLDFHTGLGKSGTFKLLAEYGLSEQEHAWLSEYLDASHLEDANAEGVAYKVRGGFGSWCKWLLSETQYTYLCAEFGTYPPLKVIAGLRAENRAVHWGKPGDAQTKQATLRLKELFCPASKTWRSQALRSGVQLIQSAAQSVTHAASVR